MLRMNGDQFYDVCAITALTLRGTRSVCLHPAFQPGKTRCLFALVICTYEHTSTERKKPEQYSSRLKVRWFHVWRRHPTQRPSACRPS